jgi:hypothetical protein
VGGAPDAGLAVAPSMGGCVAVGDGPGVAVWLGVAVAPSRGGCVAVGDGRGVLVRVVVGVLAAVLMCVGVAVFVAVAGPGELYSNAPISQ